VRCVNRIITDYCVIDVTRDGLELIELAPGTTVDAVQSMTEPRLSVKGQPKTIGAAH
jgi:3-oxoacid CoA-transferase subunit B